MQFASSSFRFFTSFALLSLSHLAVAAPAGYVERTIPLAAAPVGLAFGSQGELYALEEPAGDSGVLRTILSDGSFGPSYPVTGDDSLFFTGGMTYDAFGGRVLITDNAGDGRIYSVDALGAQQTIATGIPGIAGVAVRSTGEIFVTTAPFGSPGEVRLVDRATGASTPVLGDLGYGAGLAFDALGDLLVQDASATFTGRVQRLPIDGSGIGLSFGTAETLIEGTAASAGVGVDGEGDVFISGAGGLYVVEGSPAVARSFSSNGRPFQFSTAIAFRAGAQPFEPFAGPAGGTLAFLADYSSNEDSFITLISPAAPEDFDSSGVVDGGDLAVWSQHIGAVAPSHAMGDSDDDGDVDGSDFLAWQRALSAASLPASGGTAIPEPAGCWLILLGAAQFAWQSRNHR